MSKPTHTQEDYLRALYLLEESHNEDIKSADLASALGLNKSTISQRIQTLKQHDLIENERYGKIRLSKKGRKIAQNLTYKHRIIEMFLTETLQLNDKEAHDEAHKLEHAFSSKTIIQLANFLGNPKKCPHGKTIPDFQEE